MILNISGRLSYYEGILISREISIIYMISPISRFYRKISLCPEIYIQFQGVEVPLENSLYTSASGLCLFFSAFSETKVSYLGNDVAQEAVSLRQLILPLILVLPLNGSQSRIMERIKRTEKMRREGRWGHGEGRERG